MKDKKFIGQIREFNRYAAGSVKEDFKLDLIDRKILYLLSENARLSTTHLAKEMRIDRNTVSYRIKRMMDCDFLAGYMTLINHRRLGFKNYTVYMKLKTLTEEKSFLEYLMGLKEVTRLKNCSGSYDVQAVFTVSSEEDFIDIFDKVSDKYHSMVQSYDILQILWEDFLGLGLLLDEPERNLLHATERKGSSFQKELMHASSSGDIKLDRKDITILNVLKLDARIGINELSKKVDIAPNSVKARIRKMIVGGVIKHFLPLSSLSALGYQWWKVFFKFRNLDRKRFASYLKFHPNILWCQQFLGKWDYQLSVFAKDNAEFHKVIDDLRGEFTDNIINYDSIIVFNQFKYVQRID
jgi:DNA-binding Lrp family transcriptional regulator